MPSCRYSGHDASPVFLRGPGSAASSSRLSPELGIVPEPVRRRSFIEGTRKRKHAVQPAPPRVRHRFEAPRFAGNEQHRAARLRALLEPVAQPIGNVSEHVTAVLLRPQKDLVALEPLDVEQCHVRYSQAGVGQRPYEILCLVASPSSFTLLSRAFCCSAASPWPMLPIFSATMRIP